MILGSRNYHIAVKYILTCVLMSLLCSCHASAATTNNIQFYYINGVSPAAFYNRKDSARSLRRRLQETGKYQSTLKVISLPNQSQGTFSDIESKLVLQKQLELNGDYKNAIMDTVLMEDGHPAFAPQAIDVETYNQSLAVLGEDAIATSEYTGTIAPTVQAMATKVITAMQSGHPVVIVGHSEGTMYANELASVVRGFIPATFDTTHIPAFSNRLKVVDIATPASNAPDSDYATSAQDVVINVLAKALSAIEGFGSPLPSNEDFPNSGAFDILGHGITEVYLNPQVDTTNVVPALIASAESTVPSNLLIPAHFCAVLTKPLPDVNTAHQKARPANSVRGSRAGLPPATPR